MGFQNEVDQLLKKIKPGDMKMKKKLFVIPVEKVITGDIYVLAESEKEALEIAKDEIDYISSDDVRKDMYFSPSWQVASEEVFEDEDAERFFAINYEEGDD